MSGILNLSPTSFICFVMISISLYENFSLCSYFPGHWFGAKQWSYCPSIYLLKLFLLAPVTKCWLCRISVGAPHCVMSFSSSRLLQQQHVVFLWVSLNFLLWRLTRVQAVSFLGSLRLTRDYCITYKQVGKGTVDPTVGWWCEIAMMPAAWVS